ncbi:3-phosphoglycerate dehydrogenase, partial [Methylobacterium organophilum]|nr:3-phosphoglycerate dehydrogenase [Methylobacterium organophilum]
MPKVVISEFMDEAAIAAELAGLDVVYDPGLVDRPEDLAAAAARA